MLKDLDFVYERLDWMKREQIWPNGLRYLWTDAFGVLLYHSLYHETGERHWLDDAEQLVAAVEAVLGRPRGLRIGEEADRDGQYFHYLAMWLYALARLGDDLPAYRQKGIALAKDIHKAFVIPGVGVHWKMEEDLSGPYPGYGLGAMDAYDGYVSYRQLDEEALASEIAEMKAFMDKDYKDQVITQDLGAGMMLWLSHFYPDERWAQVQSQRCLSILDRMWVNPPGYFCRYPGQRDVKFAFTNYGVSIGLQAQGAQLDRAEGLNRFFKDYRSGDEYDRNAITHVMACCSHFPGSMLKDYAREPSAG